MLLHPIRRRLFSVSSGWLSNIPMGPSDPILGLTDEFNKVISSKAVFHIDSYLK